MTSLHHTTRVEITRLYHPRKHMTHCQDYIVDQVVDVYKHEDVTHVVTELECREKVLKYIELGDNDQTTVELLTIHWFIECMKANAVVPVEERHRVRSQMIQPVDSVSECSSDGFTVAEWACQRITPLTHHNTRFTHALETLQEYAELRGSDSDYSRALAFRRASCVLKCFPYPLSSMRQLQQIKDIGDHSKRVIQEILEDGESREVESIKNETWFQKMKMFSSVFGIGPSKAKNWISRGWTSVDDAQRHIHEFSDWRIIWGLSFHDDLTTPVIRTEAEAILDMVSVDVTALCPGAIITLIGGFRRGKPAGHDVDLLISLQEYTYLPNTFGYC